MQSTLATPAILAVKMQGRVSSVTCDAMERGLYGRRVVIKWILMYNSS